MSLDINDLVLESQREFMKLEIMLNKTNKSWCVEDLLEQMEKARIIAWRMASRIEEKMNQY